MLRAPISLQKMAYDAASGTVIYRSKMHAGLKRNFQVMPGAEWLALLCKQVQRASQSFKSQTAHAERKVPRSATADGAGRVR